MRVAARATYSYRGVFCGPLTSMAAPRGAVQTRAASGPAKRRTGRLVRCRTAKRPATDSIALVAAACFALALCHPDDLQGAENHNGAGQQESCYRAPLKRPIYTNCVYDGRSGQRAEHAQYDPRHLSPILRAESGYRSGSRHRGRGPVAHSSPSATSTAKITAPILCYFREERQAIAPSQGPGLPGQSPTDLLFC